mmetsp:Transcript_46921/g.107019  ORF Transcript_46921/g.107019 Transcript_46921/m.107019 type:complete len:194 (+) Transcript_46921:1-582(+)
MMMRSEAVAEALATASSAMKTARRASKQEQDVLLAEIARLQDSVRRQEQEAAIAALREETLGARLEESTRAAQRYASSSERVRVLEKTQATLLGTIASLKEIHAGNSPEAGPRPELTLSGKVSESGGTPTRSLGSEFSATGEGFSRGRTGSAEGFSRGMTGSAEDTWLEATTPLFRAKSTRSAAGGEDGETYV